MNQPTANRGNNQSNLVATNEFSRFCNGPGPVMLLTVVLLLPFLNKAYHIDDTLFVRVAEQVCKNPFHPFGMDYNWMGKHESFWKATQNPPLGGYLIAAVSIFTGWLEWPMHLAFAGFAVACSLLMYLLAKRYCTHPTLAVAATIVTPAFVVSACNVMADIPLLFFWLLAVWSAVKYVESQRSGFIWMSALAVSAAAMTKYFGAALVPLLVVYCLSEPKGRRWQVVSLLLPVAVLAAWGFYSMRECGEFHPLSAASTSIEYKEIGRVDSVRGAGYTLTFLGGGLLWPIGVAPFLAAGARNRILIAVKILGILSFVGLMTAFEYRPSTATEELAQAPRWLYATMLCCGSVTVIGVIQGWSAKFDRPGMLLALWFFGTLAFCVFFNWTINERIILPALFPAALLTVRGFESLNRAKWATVCLTTALVPVTVVALLVAGADYEFASAGRAYSQTTVRQYIREGRQVLFAGHWGLQYYMEREGAVPLDFSNLRLRKGDIVIYPRIHTTPEPPPFERYRILSDTQDQYANQFGLYTMSSGAGFYASMFGTVPFAPAEEPYADRFIALEGIPLSQQQR